MNIIILHVSSMNSILEKNWKNLSATANADQHLPDIKDT